MKKKTSQPIRVLIAGDNYIIRSGLRRILESQSNILVLGEIKIGTGKELEVFREQPPDIVLIDIGPHSADALAFISKVKKDFKDTAILLIGDLGDDKRTRKALDFGAAGVVLKMQPPSVLIATIESLYNGLDGHVVLGKAEPDVRSNNGLQSRENPQSYEAKIQSLTGRERDIIALIAEGLKNKDIAERLHISDITVRHHLSNIFMKFGISNRQKLLILAHHHGLVRLTRNPQHLDPVIAP